MERAGRHSGLWGGSRVSYGYLPGNQMALLMVGGGSESLRWQLSLWDLLDGLSSRRKARGCEDGTVTLLR